MTHCLPVAVVSSTVTVSKSPRSAIVCGSTKRLPMAVTVVDLFAEHEAGHVEVMDRHVPKDAAQFPQIADGRQAGIARGDRHLVQVADQPVADSLLHGAMARIEPAHEAEHDRHGRAADALGAKRDARRD